MSEIKNTNKQEPYFGQENGEPFFAGSWVLCLALVLAILAFGYIVEGHFGGKCVFVAMVFAWASCPFWGYDFFKAIGIFPKNRGNHGRNTH